MSGSVKQLGPICQVSIWRDIETDPKINAQMLKCPRSHFTKRQGEVVSTRRSDRTDAARLLPKSHRLVLNPKGILPAVGEKLAPPWFGGGSPLHGAAVRWGLSPMERVRDAQPSLRLVRACRGSLTAGESLVEYLCCRQVCIYLIVSVVGRTTAKHQWFVMWTGKSMWSMSCSIISPV